MPKPNTVQDCRGFEVSCDDGCWYGHISIYHPDIIKYCKHIEVAIKTPKNGIIYWSETQKNHYVYYGKIVTIYGRLRVAVEKIDDKHGEIRSAYFALNFPEKRIAWQCEKMK